MFNYIQPARHFLLWTPPWDLEPSSGTSPGVVISPGSHPILGSWYLLEAILGSWYLLTEGKMNLQNSNQGSMKRLSFLSTISILILNIEETLFKTVHWYFFKRFSSICKNTIEIVLRKDRRFILPWLLFHEFKNIQYYSYTIE